jgi:molybdate transport system ATP-binding protein
MTTKLTARLKLSQDAFNLDVELEVHNQGITALFGPSGAGKTTLLRALAGLESCTGHISIGNQTWLNEHSCLPAHQRRSGYVFQEASLFDHLTVHGNLDYAFSRAASNNRLISYDDAVSLLDLGGLLQRPAAKLSGGERKRVAIARALLSNPAILLLDEPLASLDTARKAELLPFLEKLNDSINIPIIYVSHSPEEVARLAHQLILMDAGRITAAGPINEILTRFDLPIVLENDAAVVIDATPGYYDDEYDLTELIFVGGRLWAPGKLQHKNDKVRVRVLARDVSLTLEQQTDTSILNIIPATVTDLMADASAQTLVRLDVAGTPLMARITRKSAAALELKPGKQLYSQIKTIALL